MFGLNGESAKVMYSLTLNTVTGQEYLQSRTIAVIRKNLRVMNDCTLGDI